MKSEHYSEVLKTMGSSASAFLWYLIEWDENRLNKNFHPNGSASVPRSHIAENTNLKRKAQIACEKLLEDRNIITITRSVNENIYTIHYKNI